MGFLKSSVVNGPKFIHQPRKHGHSFYCYRGIPELLNSKFTVSLSAQGSGFEGNENLPRVSFVW